MHNCIMCTIFYKYYTKFNVIPLNVRNIWKDAIQVYSYLDILLYVMGEASVTDIPFVV